MSHTQYTDMDKILMPVFFVGSQGDDQGAVQECRALVVCTSWVAGVEYSTSVMTKFLESETFDDTVS